MKKQLLLLVCTAILLIHMSGARAVIGTYTISEKAVKTSQTGQIHGVLNYCRGVQAIIDTNIYIPGSSFKVTPARTPDSNFWGNFNIFYIPAGTYSLVFDLPGNAEDYRIDDIEVRDGYITEFGEIDVCRDLDSDGFDERTDCNDNDDLVNPSAREACYDEVDNNCNNLVNEDCVYCLDSDNDGFYGAGGINGDGNLIICPFPTDCNDNNQLVSPVAIEIFDTLDNNCNSQIDEGFCGASGEVCVYPDTCVAGVCSNQ